MPDAVLDRLAAREAVARLQWAVDDQDWVAFRAAVTDDFSQILESLAHGRLELVGGDEVVTALQARSGSLELSVHADVNLVVDVAGDRATARSWQVGIAGTTDQPARVIVAEARYDLRRHGEVWLVAGIAQRQVHAG